ncbi:MAG: uncharacterized protein JWN50_675 [Parcubacteria group bacterium]|nr:uncharacterized protein [Parcubacteria group bacterium]
MHGFNYVDILIVFALIAYVLLHVRDGVLVLTQRLLGLVGGAILAFLSYTYVSAFLAPRISAPPGVLDAASFVVMFLLLQSLVKFILRKIFLLIPEDMRHSKFSVYLAAVPALIDGLILVSLILFLLVVAPYFIAAKQPIEDSKLGSVLVDRASGIETYLDEVFSKATESTLGFMTVEPQEGESVALPFKATNLSTDETAETEMLALINAERLKAGVGPLVMDATLQKVARAHSRDMWVRAYFAHTDPDGLDPFDRMRAGGAKFRTAGENLALARTTERAHEGLMNSPGHKRNILDPAFKRVGIGVIDGGVYGKMFTQDFSD